MACDRIYVNGKDTDYTEGKLTIPFIALYNNKKDKYKVYMGKNHGTHGDDIFDSYLDDTFKSLYTNEYRGRLFFDDKVITFWQYPSKIQLEHILKKIKISKDWNISKPNWDDWRIELYKNNTRPNSFYDSSGYIYVPIKNYNGGDNPPDEIYQQHIKSPLNKTGISNYKMRHIKYKLPSEPEIVAKRRLKYMYQEKLITKFNFFKN